MSGKRLPVYVVIKRDLKTVIEDGELSEGAQVPTELELMASYGVSRHSVRQALRDLEVEGYVERNPGRGTFVAPARSRHKVLATTGENILALVCQEIESRFSQSIVQGFVMAAREQGYNAMVYFMNMTDEPEWEFLTELRNSGFSGIALNPGYLDEPTIEVLRSFHKTSFPFVLVDHYCRDLDLDSVTSDNEDLGYRLTKALIDRGHRRIGHITCPLEITSTQDRYDGYLRALQEAGIAHHKGFVGIIDPSGPAVTSVLTPMMARKLRPTALVCGNDWCTGVVVDELDHLGFSIPGDVELASVDDNDVYESLDVPVLHAKQAGQRMGEEAARRLVERVAGAGLETRHLTLKATLYDMPEAVRIAKLPC